MLPLAFSTNAFKKNTLEEAIDSIAAAGYGAVELMADLHHAYPGTFDAARRRDTAKRLADLGLTVSNINAFTHFVDGDTYHPTWIETDPKLTAKRIDHTRRCLDLAHEFGATTVSIQPGGPLQTSGMLSENAYEQFANGIDQCIATAVAAGVVIAIEPEPGLLIERASEFLAFKNHFFAHEKLVQMNCDIGHLFCVGEDPAAIIREMAHHIAHVHVEDIGANRVHQHLTPGRGVIKFSDVFAALRDVGYAGHATVELYPYESTAAGVAQAAFEHLKPIADAVTAENSV